MALRDRAIPREPAGARQFTKAQNRAHTSICPEKPTGHIGPFTNPTQSREVGRGPTPEHQQNQWIVARLRPPQPPGRVTM
jgi:hypothetical protein